MKRLNLASLSSLALAALLTPNLAWSLEYKLSTQFPASQKTTVLNFFESAKALLPKVVQDSIKTINVSFEDIKALQGEPLGRVSPYTGHMSISNKLIPAILAGESNSKLIDRAHKTAYKEALATLLHETIHVYDGLNNHTDEEYKWIRTCNPVVTNDKVQKSVEDKLPAVCRYYKNMYLTFSQNPYFLFASGFIQDANGMKERSPDPYELSSSKESLAVNMEYFLLDPQFKCRKPTLYRLLSSHFQHVPFAGVNCEGAMSFVLPNSGNSPAQMMNIDPARVYQVHYLLADKGDAMMSGWGHAMIRLVICKPGRPLGPECMLDLDQHVVLSYRAFVDSLSLSSLDGMTGKYPSRLFIIPLQQIVDEYNKGELRALKSLPLKLSRKEVEDVVTRSVESHWSYNGKYYFISNNCATESLNLIRSAIFNFDLLKLEVKTPMDLYDSLIRLGRADDSVFKNLKQSMPAGYYFDSYEDRYKVMFDILKTGLNLPEKDFKEFIALSALQRRAYINRVPKNSPDALKYLANFMILEAAAQRKVQTMVLGQVQKVALDEMSKAENAASTSKELNKAKQLGKSYLELSGLFAKPSDFLKGETGYGLPSLEESATAQKSIQSSSTRSIEVDKEAKSLVESLISRANLKEMEDLKKNAEIISAAFREAMTKKNASKL